VRRFGRIAGGVATVLSLVLFLASLAGWVASRWYSFEVTRTAPAGRVQQSQRMVTFGLASGQEGVWWCRVTDVRAPAAAGQRPPPPPPPVSWEARASRSRGGISWSDPMFAPFLKGVWRRWGFMHGTFDDPLAGLNSWEGRPSYSTTELFIVPWWALLAAFGPLPLGRGLVALARRRRRLRVSAGRCAKCGYDLRATPQRCPECGAAAPTAS
jgi:hypothetical protein